MADYDLKGFEEICPIYTQWAAVKNSAFTKSEGMEFNKWLGDKRVVPYKFKSLLHIDQGINKKGRTIISKGLQVEPREDYTRIDKFIDEDGKWCFLDENNRPQTIKIFVPKTPGVHLEYSDRKGSKKPNLEVGQVWMWMFAYGRKTNPTHLVIRGAYEVVRMQSIDEPFNFRYMLRRL